MAMSKSQVKSQGKSQGKSQVKFQVIYQLKFEVKFYCIRKLTTTLKITTFETNRTKYLQSRTYTRNPFPPPTSSVA